VFLAGSGPAAVLFLASPGSRRASYVHAFGLNPRRWFRNHHDGGPVAQWRSGEIVVEQSVHLGGVIDRQGLVDHAEIDQRVVVERNVMPRRVSSMALT